MPSINGYEILRDFTSIGGGLCRWTFARKDGKEYFLKEFLEPKYPVDGSPGSDSYKAKKRERCNRFEVYHETLRKTLRKIASPDGNLVVTVDFFRDGSIYYKVTEKVEATGLSPQEISLLPFAQKKLILISVAHSLSILHGSMIVHGDLKPDNILIKQKNKDMYVAKLIDFDNSYISKSPPEISDESDIVGTENYYSPEMGLYIKRDPRINTTDLDTNSDIYALGIIFCQYLTGDIPIFPREYRYTWESSLSGSTPQINPKGIPKRLEELVNKMLLSDPKSRPSILKVFSDLKTCDNTDFIEPVSRLVQSKNLK